MCGVMLLTVATANAQQVSQQEAFRKATAFFNKEQLPTIKQRLFLLTRQQRVWQIRPLGMMPIITAQSGVDNSETFQLVTDASTLHANDIILVVYGAGSRALSTALSEGNRTSAAVTITDNSIVLDKDNNNVARICLGGNSSAWTFYDTNNTPGYLFNDVLTDS